MSKRGDKLVISDLKFKKPKIANNVELCPTQEYSITTIVEPIRVTNLDTDNTINFEIKAGRIFSFIDIGDDQFSCIN